MTHDLVGKTSEFLGIQLPVQCVIARRMRHSIDTVEIGFETAEIERLNPK